MDFINRLPFLVFFFRADKSDYVFIFNKKHVLQS